MEIKISPSHSSLAQFYVENEDMLNDQVIRPVPVSQIVDFPIDQNSLPHSLTYEPLIRKSTKPSKPPIWTSDFLCTTITQKPSIAIVPSPISHSISYSHFFLSNMFI